MTGPAIQTSLNLAVAHHRAGRFADAENLYRAILHEQPDHGVALHLLGVLTGQRGNHQAAIDLIRRAIAIDPTNADFHSNLGKFLIELGDPDAAIAACRKAIALNPSLADAYLNLGVALQAQDQLDAAIDAFRRALELKPDYAEAHGNLGAVFKALGQLDAAGQSIRAALALNPDLADAQWNLALLELLRGNFAQGWPQYERRLTFPENASLTSRFPHPGWTGQDIRGKTILLIAEQGFGDTIQFIRYAAMLEQRGAKVIALVRAPLARLLQRAAGVAQVSTESDTITPFDFQCPLLSLPGIFGTTLQTIPAEIPYIRPDPSLVSQWAARFDPSDRRPRVGVAWAGSPTHKNDRIRSIPSTLLNPLAEVKDVKFLSLQRDRLPSRLDITDWSADLSDFADTAALIANLDVVISVDTAVAHLAGAIGKPVWIMLPYILDWRWLLNRPDSPWYPTMRLFRQPSRGDWAGVVQTISAELRAHVLASGERSPQAKPRAA